METIFIEDTLLLFFFYFFCFFFDNIVITHNTGMRAHEALCTDQGGFDLEVEEVGLLNDSVSVSEVIRSFFFFFIWTI